MTTRINLEKELLKQNAKIVQAEELLSIREYERLGEDLTNDHLLTSIGINRAARQGKEITDKNANLYQETLRFNREKVFHVSQIEKLCNKYRLKFLPAKYFNGSIDNELANKLAQFQVAYDLQNFKVPDAFEGISNAAKRRKFINYLYDNRKNIGEHNTFIAAPASSFKLEKRPKDPLFFYQINDEYYYLVHKWGNDLHWSRRLLPLLAGTPGFWLKFIIVWFVFTLIPWNYSPTEKIHAYVWLYTIFPLCATGLLSLFTGAIGFIYRNQWNINYKNEKDIAV